MGVVVDKALGMLPASAQRLVVAMALGGLMTAGYLNLTGTIASAHDATQAQIDQMKKDGSHRDDRLDKIEAILGVMATNQASMQQSVIDTNTSMQRIENKVDTLPARIEHRHPTD